MSERQNGDLSAEELEELRESVSALRAELSSRFGLNTREPGQTEGPSFSPLLDWVRDLGRNLRSRFDALEGVNVARIYDEFRQWVPLLGMEDRSVDVDEFGFDRLFVDRVRSLLDFLYERWWRVQVTGSENLAGLDRVLLVSNRSGVLPYDGLMIAEAVQRECSSEQRPRFLVADWLATLPFFQAVLSRLGGVRACPENAERLLENGHWVIAFPEGQKGALKPFRDRYQLQRFGRGGFVSLALRLRAAIVPVAVVGAEEVHPILARSSLAGRLLGFPVPLTPTFPLLGPFGLVPLPSQWRIRFGKAIRWEDADPRADDALFINRMRDRIRSQIQSFLEEEVHRRNSIWS